MTHTKEPIDFDLMGVDFRLRSFPVMEAMALLPNVAVLVAPLLALSSGQAAAPEVFMEALFKHIGTMGTSLKELPVIQTALAKRCTVALEGKGWVELFPNLDAVFVRRYDLFTAWTVKCVVLEFGSFLPGIMSFAVGPPQAEASPLSFPTG